jgi:ABC-type phosphate transport system substrate-binding protein
MTRYLATLVLLASTASAAADLSLRVVVNEANPTSSISLDELSDLFLKKTSQWSGGSRAVPVDQPQESRIHQSFTREVHRKSAAGLRAYWQQRIFSGRDVPPLQRESDAEVIEFVRKNPGAVGYVSAAASVAGVKAIKVHP